MKLLDRVHGTTGIRVIVGSAFFWAWLDALFMSVFFAPPAPTGLLAEAAAVAVFSLSVPGFVSALVRPATFNRLIAGRRLPLAAAGLGTVGSLLFIVAGQGAGWPTLVAGGLCAAVFMATFQLGWGAAYSQDGARTAVPFVAGAFACALVIDTPLLFMVPAASAVFFALLPLLSGLFFVTLTPAQRSYRLNSESASVARPRRNIRSYLKTHLGISMTLLAAVTLVMTSFGYLQHLVSFSTIADGTSGGILVQVARGVTGILAFVFIVVFGRRASTVYRVGLLAMVAGFMMMAFMFSTEFFWISGAIIIAGYTTFDLFVWVAFAQIAHAQSRNPLNTIAVMRLLSIACYVVGAACGIALVGNDGTLHPFVAEITTTVGYLVVIATVLLLSSEDMWTLFGRAPLVLGDLSSDERTNQDAQLEAWFDAIGLTSRERDIAVPLAYGRTQPWIAERLSISENTVGTHVRHIYQKAEVHGRQEFIDRALPNDQALRTTSRERREVGDALTEDA